MFVGAIMHLPGEELRHFRVLRPETRETARGRVVTNEFTEVGHITAILAQARPEEVVRWQQLEHPITHKIIMRCIPPFEVLSGDIFEREGRRFYMQAKPYDVGDIHHWMIFYCDERNDVV